MALHHDEPNCVSQLEDFWPDTAEANDNTMRILPFCHKFYISQGNVETLLR